MSNVQTHKTVAIYLWGGERQTADHRIIATTTYRIKTSNTLGLAIERALDLAGDGTQTLAEYAVETFGNPRSSWVNTRVHDWDTPVEFWEIVETWDEYDDEDHLTSAGYVLTTSDTYIEGSN